MKRAVCLLIVFLFWSLAVVAEGSSRVLWIEIDTIMSWGHYTLVEDELDEELMPLARERGIGVMNAAPLMQRLLAEDDLPEWHRGPKPLLDIKPKLVQLCRDAGVDIAKVAMKFALEKTEFG